MLPCVESPLACPAHCTLCIFDATDWSCAVCVFHAQTHTLHHSVLELLRLLAYGTANNEKKELSKYVRGFQFDIK